MRWNYIVCTPPPLGDGGGGAEPFFRTFIQEGLRSNLDFGWELVLQVGVIFLRWDLKTSCIKNSEYKPQAKTKMIPIVISTISHFWSPTLTIYGSMYLYHYFAWYIQPPTYKYFLLQSANFFIPYLVASGWEYSKFFTDLLY